MSPLVLSFVLSGPTATELSRMFPTPPSLENQQTLSPCQTADITEIAAVYALPPAVMTDVDSARTEAFKSATKPGHSEVGLFNIAAGMLKLQYLSM